ncbi:two-component system sensor histidine kinase/response regulator, putative, partial [Ricinus communis]
RPAARAEADARPGRRHRPAGAAGRTPEALHGADRGRRPDQHRSAGRRAEGRVRDQGGDQRPQGAGDRGRLPHRYHPARHHDARDGRLRDVPPSEIRSADGAHPHHLPVREGRRRRHRGRPAPGRGRLRVEAGRPDDPQGAHRDTFVAGHGDGRPEAPERTADRERAPARRRGAHDAPRPQEPHRRHPAREPGAARERPAGSAARACAHDRDGRQPRARHDQPHARHP